MPQSEVIQGSFRRSFERAAARRPLPTRVVGSLAASQASIDRVVQRPSCMIAGSSSPERVKSWRRRGGWTGATGACRCRRVHQPRQRQFGLAHRQRPGPVHPRSEGIKGSPWWSLGVGLPQEAALTRGRGGRPGAFGPWPAASCHGPGIDGGCRAATGFAYPPHSCGSRGGTCGFRLRCSSVLIDSDHLAGVEGGNAERLRTSDSDPMRTCALGPESASILPKEARMSSDQRKLPLESSASASRRRALSRGWLSEGEADKRLGGSMTASEARRTGRILGVWVSEEGHYLYPEFQFSSEHALGAIKSLLQWLPKASGSGWDQVEWLYAPHPRLDARTPSETLLVDPEKVIVVAESQFTRNPDENW